MYSFDLIIYLTEKGLKKENNLAVLKEVTLILRASYQNVFLYSLKNISFIYERKIYRYEYN